MADLYLKTVLLGRITVHNNISFFFYALPSLLIQFVFICIHYKYNLFYFFRFICLSLVLVVPTLELLLLLWHSISNRLSSTITGIEFVMLV